MFAIVLFGFAIPIPPAKPDPARAAVTAAVPILVAGATGHADQKSCFACHNQAYPALALAAAQDRGFDVPAKFFAGQAEHIAEFLATNKKQFLEGKGTGGQAATASFALLTLELAGHKPDDTTAAVAQYLLKFEPTRDHWRTNSNRPPTESSDFTTTYVAMRALRTYGAKDDREKIAKRVETARGWLIKTPAKETEDRVFRLLGLKEAGAGEKEIAAAAWELLKTQRADGGWSQLDDGKSDAYATGSALYRTAPRGRSEGGYGGVQGRCRVPAQEPVAGRDVEREDRGVRPFQPYYESGFPHEKDQFISISASGWATAALVAAMK